MSQTTIDRLNGINEGVSIKAPVDAATTANITLSGEQTVDGVALTASVAPTQPMRVLVKNQTDTTKNGIYDVSTSAWTRSLDFNGTRDIVQGTLVFVKAGTKNINKLFKVATASPAIDSALAFTEATFYNSGWINVMDYGAINTGVATPLSTVYSTLAAAQVDYPTADALTDEFDSVAIEKAIAAAVTLNQNTVYFPTSKVIGGYYRDNKFIDAPYTLSSREGVINFVGELSSADNKNYEAIIKRTISAAGLRIIGTSLSVNAANHLIKRVNIVNLTWDGGWSSFNTNSDYPMVSVNSGYELFWHNAVVTNALWGVLFREVFDCRFNNLVVTVCGEKHGKSLSLTMTNTSTTATCSSTTGIFAGQKIYGTGVNDMRVASITNSTTIVLSTAANFTGARTVVFEAKAAVHVCANNSTNATSNNQVITGLRIESGPGCGLRMQGPNQVDLWLNQCKIEQTQYAVDYLLDIENAVAVKSRDLWLYGAPDKLNYMEWPITTAGSTLATALSARILSFTLNTYLVSNGTLTSGSAVVTGISSTTNLTIGQRVVGTGIADDGVHNVCILSIDSGTQITMTHNAVSTGVLSLTFQYFLDSGIFSRRYFSSGMPMLVWDTEDTRNYAFCRVTNYGATTGLLALHVLNVFGDTSKSITSWKVALCHAGLARVGGAASMCQLDIIGGYPSAVDSATYPYIHTMVHVDGALGLDSDIRVNQGHQLLPKNSWQAQTSTTSNTVGTGAKTFTIATGLHATMFAANGEVYISGNSVGNAQNWMKGTITSYTSGTGALVTNITEIQGSGTLTSWKVAFAKQSAYLQTGTNSNLVLKEINPTYGVPAASANFTQPILSDVIAETGSNNIRNIVQYTAAQFAAITPKNSTIYVVKDTNKIYIGSTLVSGSPVVDYSQDFRLTLTTSTPVTTADVFGGVTIYCTPYKGNRISLYDGTNWTIRNSSEFSLSIGTLTSNLPYDVFCYDNAGIPTLEFTPWNTTATRVTGLSYQDGILVKSGATTRRYLGTFLTVSTTQVEDSIAKRYLWNYYNRVPRLMERIETTASWVYTTATVRQANASASNQLNCFIGVVEDPIFAKLNSRCANSASGTEVRNGIGLNSVTTFSAAYSSQITTLANAFVMHTPTLEAYPVLGLNYFAWLEYSSAAGTTTWDGASVFGLQGAVLG